MRIHKYIFKIHETDHGSLVAIEECKDIPFHIRRVYYMYGAESGVTRGFHAYKLLDQVIVCLYGSCKIVLDDGKERKTTSLVQPNEGVYLTHGIWRELFDFSPDAVLMVLASDLYDESDYIRDYDEFLRYVKDHKDIVDDETDDEGSL